MRPLHAQSHLVFFLLLASSMSKASNLENACKYVAANNRDVVGYDYCINFFQADKGSATADKPAVAAIATKITRVAAKNICERIAALKAYEKDKIIQMCLGSCARMYSQTEYNLGMAVKGVASDLAMSYLAGAADTPDTCEDGFRQFNKTSLLAAENSEFTKKAVIALSVTHSTEN